MLGGDEGEGLALEEGGRSAAHVAAVEVGEALGVGPEVVGAARALARRSLAAWASWFFRVRFLWAAFYCLFNFF